MKLFPSQQDVRDGAQQLGLKCVVLAVFILACGGITIIASSPINYIVLVIGLLLAGYAVALVAVVNWHQRCIHSETMAGVARLEDEER